MNVTHHKVILLLEKRENENARRYQLYGRRACNTNDVTLSILRSIVVAPYIVAQFPWEIFLSHFFYEYYFAHDMRMCGNVAYRPLRKRKKKNGREEKNGKETPTLTRRDQLILMVSRTMRLLLRHTHTHTHIANTLHTVWRQFRSE